MSFTPAGPRRNSLDRTGQLETTGGSYQMFPAMLSVPSMELNYLCEVEQEEQFPPKLERTPELRYLGRVVVRILIDDSHLEELLTEKIAENLERCIHLRVVEE